MNLYEYQRPRSFTDLGPGSLTFNFSIFFFFLETARPVEAKLHVEPLWDWGTKVYTNGPCHMSNMVAMPINGKSLKNLLWNQKADALESWYAALGT